MAESYVIIGDGNAGATAAKTLREESDDADITVLTDESEPLYNRIMLKSYMKGDLPGTEFTRVHDESWYGKRDIDLELETRVENVDLDSKEVETAGGESYSYDRLLIATGGSPRKFPADDSYRNVHYVWTMQDSVELKSAAEESEKAVVIGGGLLGIDLAVAYAENDTEVDYLIREENWWHRGLDSGGAELIHDRLEEKGVNVVTDTGVEEFDVEDDEVVAAISRSGDRYECDSVAVAIGQVPNSSIVDVDKNARGMVKVDEHLRTSEEDVYAAGNMVEYCSPVFERRVVNGSWDHSEAMGRCAARNMLGADFSDEKSCSEQQSGEDWCGQDTGFDYVNTYGVGHFDVQFLAIGDWSGEPVSRKYSDSEYRRLFFRDDRLVGVVLIGFTEGQERIREMIREKETVESRQELLEKQFWE